MIKNSFILLAVALAIIACGGHGTSSVSSSAGSADPSGTSSGNEGGNTAAAAVNVAGSWSFSNGINTNLVQNGSALAGEAAYFGSNGIIEPCSSLTGTVSDLTVAVSISSCAGGAANASFSGTANLSGNLITGAVTGYIVPNVTGTYNGMLTFLNSSGVQIGTSAAVLNISEDNNQNLQATLTLEAPGTISPTPNLSGTGVGGALDIAGGVGGGGISGLVGSNNAISLFVLDAELCNATACSKYATGTFTKQ